jgi:uncharacterized protein (TIGR02594 family)
MTITRIFSDVPEEEVGPLIAGIKADNGSFTKVAQEDHLFTITALLPFDAPEEESSPAHLSEFPWMPVARAEMGMTRAADPARIDQYLETTGVVSDQDSIPWCSAFVNFCISHSGIRGTNSALARSWLGWGVDAGGLIPGCVVVLSRGAPPHGHVGFYAGMEGDHVQLLGGNQHGAVNIASFLRDRIIGVRKASP